MFKKMWRAGLFASMVLTLGGCGDDKLSVEENAGADSDSEISEAWILRIAWKEASK